MPSWLHDPLFHASHRAALVRKDPVFYASLATDDLDPETPYVWPDPDPRPRRRPPTRPRRPAPACGWCGRRRPASSGASSPTGWSGSAPRRGSGPTCPAWPGPTCRPLLREESPGRRGGKALRQLAAFLDDVREGDEVAVPVEEGRALLLGTVRGGYAHAPGGTAPVHRRPVVWDGGRLPREAARPRGVLQDPRELFRVSAAGPTVPG